MRRELPVALAASLLSLALGAVARAEEPNLDVATSLLLEPELRDDQARASEASDVLSADRKRKLADLSSAFVDLGLHASVQASPLRLLRSAARIGRGVRDWSDRTSAEDEALALLEPGARSGGLDDENLALYLQLEQRVSEERIAQLLDEAEQALGAGDLRRCRRALDRALAMEPGSVRADRLLDALDERAWLTEHDRDEAAELAEQHLRVETWEVELGAALLVEDFDRAQALGPHGSNHAEFARATGAYLAGDREGALESFREVAEGDDAAAKSAASALADPQLNPEDAFEAEVNRYRTRRALGWMGGDEFVATALPSSSEAISFANGGYRAWQDSLRAWRKVIKPVNLVLDAPARIWRSWQPDGKPLHAAAQNYLALLPEGPRADDAAGWIAPLGARQEEDPRVAPFRDGVLVLPHARTPFDRLAATRVVVSRKAIEAATPELLARFASEDDAAFELVLDTEFGREVDDVDAGALSQAESLDLLARLASGIESSTLASRGSNQKGVLALLRRLDARVRGGGALVASAWVDEIAPGLDAFGMALVDGERARTIGAVEMERRRETFVAERQLGGSTSYCPQETTCIDTPREREPVFYLSSDADGEVGIGARAGFEGAQLSLELGMDGPKASLVVPFAQWFGIARFFPVEGRLGVGLDGISAGPGRDDEADDLPDP